VDAREERGLQIVLFARYQITKKGGVWLVPSQTGQGPKYTVCLDAEEPHCSCPDHAETGRRCKHIYAAEYVYQRQLFDDGSVAETETITVSQKRVTYPQQWSSYNRAQVNEKEKFQALLKDLCDRIQEPPRNKMGRPRMPLNDAIFAAVFKVYSTVSGRRFASDLRAAKENGLVNFAPAYNSIFKVLESEETTDVLKALIVESAKPLKAMESTFACDSTGFSGCRFEKWYDHKFRDIRIQRTWVKAHVMTGTNTSVITAVEIHDKDANDGKQFQPLLAATAENFNVQEVCADLAYSSRANVIAVAALNAMPLIPFKKNATARTGGVWEKMFHYFHLKRDEFMARYHQRSKIESAFSMIKAKFGDSVRSKTDVAMKNEVLAKFVCHNICCLIATAYELGVDPTLWAGSSFDPNVGQTA
jgi:transposase